MTNEFMPRLSIVIPAYNEEERIGSTLDRIIEYATQKQGLLGDTEILVVSDGSNDQTVTIAQERQGRFPKLRVIDNKANHGKGWVVRQGMLEAKGSLRLFTDADNATPIEEIEKLLPFVKSQGMYDIAIGSIGLKERKVEQAEPLPRVIAGRLANFLIQTVAVPGIQDTQRGFKLFSGEAATAIFSLTKIDRWGFDIEEEKKKSNTYPPSELRRDLISGDWVVIATGRGKRPGSGVFKRSSDPIYEKKEGCPFENLEASGNPPPIFALTKSEASSSSDWFVQVIPNKYPAFGGTARGMKEKVGPFEVKDGTGFHEVITTRVHNRPMALSSQAEPFFLWRVYRLLFHLPAREYH